MWPDFTLGSSFEVKRWLIGFGEFSSGGYNLHQSSNVLDLVLFCVCEDLTGSICYIMLTDRHINGQEFYTFPGGIYTK